MKTVVVSPYGRDTAHECVVGNVAQLGLNFECNGATVARVPQEQVAHGDMTVARGKG